MPMSDRNMGLMSGAGAIGAGFGNIFSDYTNPADPAMQYMNQIPDVLKQYMNPYIQRGQGALDQSQNQYNQLINDPGSMYNKFASGYQQSPGFQFALKQALGSVNNQSSAQGMSLSPAADFNRMQTATGLANQDFGNYMNHVTSLYDTGLHGMGGIGQMGFDASKSLSENLAQALMGQSMLAYQGQNNQNEHDVGGWGSILSGIGQGAASYAFM